MKGWWLALALLGPVQAMDQNVQAWTQSARSPALDRFARAVTSLGTPKTGLAALLAIAVLEPIEGVTVARLAVLAAIPANLAVEVLKRTLRRVRPDGNPDPVNSSFPSSHAANAVALAYVLGKRWRRWRIGLWLLAALVAACRVYVNRHYASDVLAGGAIGLGSALAMTRWAGPWLARHAPGPARWLRGEAEPA